MEEPSQPFTTHPFSCSRPSMELQPGPPLSHIVISLLAFGLSDGKYQKNSWFSSLSSLVIGRVPAYDSPMSKGTSGMPLPSTSNSAWSREHHKFFYHHSIIILTLRFRGCMQFLAMIAIRPLEELRIRNPLLRPKVRCFVVWALKRSGQAKESSENHTNCIHLCDLRHRVR